MLIYFLDYEKEQTSKQLWRSYQIKRLVGWPRQRLGSTRQIERQVFEVERRTTLAREAATTLLCLEASSIFGNLRGAATRTGRSTDFSASLYFVLWSRGSGGYITVFGRGCHTTLASLVKDKHGGTTLEARVATLARPIAVA